MKEKFYVEIGGVKLGIVSEEGQAYVEAVANAVNDKINAMVSKNRSCSLLEAALFCALDSYSSGEGDAKKVKNLEAQIALYQANVNRLKKENEELRQQVYNTTKLVDTDAGMIRILRDEINRFYHGQLTAEEAAAAIQSKATIYVSEQFG